MTLVKLCKNTKTYEGKSCQKCNTTLKYESNGSCVSCVQKESRDKYRQHPQKYLARSIERYKNNPDPNRDIKYRRLYGITLADYNRLLTKQNGTCAICDFPCKTGRRLCVDHCHKTGEVRGLLCINCNRAIGNLNDNVLLFEKALKYLRERVNK